MIHGLTLLLSVLLLSPAPSQRAATGADATTAVISGTVTDDTGAPADAVRVSVFSRSARMARATMTDETGRYEIRGLPPASYTLTASRPGFLTRRFGQTTESGPGTPVTVGSDSSVVADVRLPRLGAVSGTVVDVHGQPVATTVGVYRWLEMQAVRALRPGVTTMSDRYGRYRFEELPPGEYLIGASATPEDMEAIEPTFVRLADEAARNPAAPLPTRTEEAGTVSYITSYYPGVASPRAAVAIDMAPGRENRDIDLRLLLVPTTLVEGVVLESNGDPAESKIVVLVSPDDNTPTGLAGATGPGGRFRIGTVPHGNYLLISGATAVNFVATGRRVTDLTLTLPADVEVAGRVLYAGQDAPPTVTRKVLSDDVQLPAAAVISLKPWGPPPISGVPLPGGNIRVRPDGLFSGRVQPGTYTASAVSLAPDWSVESVMHGEQDLIDLPVTLRDGQPLTDLIVTLVDQTTEISGVLRHPDGTPEFGILMLAFSADRRYWTDDSRRVQTARPDTTGQFRFTGLPPGDYLLAAATDFDTGNGIGQEALDGLAAVGTPVSLVRGQRTTIDFTVGGR